MPNAAVTCTFTDTGVTNAVTVVKELVGFGDLGLFNLLVDGNVVAPNVGDGGQGTSGTILAGTTVTVTETAGTDTSLGNYTSSLACQSGGQPITVINGQFTMPAAAVTCTFTNTRVTNSVTLTKGWVNARPATRRRSSSSATRCRTRSRAIARRRRRRPTRRQRHPLARR